MLPQTLEQLDALRAECKAMVTKRAGLSAGAAVLPIPGLDLGADIALLVELIPAINQKFGLAPEQIEGLDPKLKRVILIGATSVGNNLIGKWVTKQLVMRSSASASASPPRRWPASCPSSARHWPPRSASAR